MKVLLAQKLVIHLTGNFEGLYLWVKELQLKPYLTFSEHLRGAEYSVKNFSIVFNPHEKLKKIQHC